MKKTLLLAALIWSVASHAQTKYMVTVRSNSFTPKDLVINQGDTVVWTNVQGFHNVNGLQSTYPSNTSNFGNNVAGPGWTFEHVFVITGNNDYVCDPHAGFGMVGTVLVNPVSSISAIKTENFVIGGLQKAGETITISTTVKPKLTVLSLGGREIFKVAASAVLNIPSEAGIYFVLVEYATQKNVFKILVE